MQQERRKLYLWRNKDVCRTTPCSDLGFCLSLNCSVKPLFSIPWQPRYPKCLLSKKRKVDKEYAEVFKTFGPFPTFLRGRMGYLYVRCAHSRFKWWKNIGCFVKVAPVIIIIFRLAWTFCIKVMKTVGSCHYLKPRCFTLITLVRPAWD